MSALTLQLRTLARTRPWFASLLDAYDFIDESLQRELYLTAQKGRQLACHPGCLNCCFQPIPVSLAEIMGLELAFKTGLMPLPPAPQPLTSLPGVESSTPNRQGNKPPNRLGQRCRFLNTAGFCGVYELRPIACRRYLVYGTPCQPGEDASTTRPQDLHRPDPAALLHALRLTLPCYKNEIGLVENPAEVERSFFDQHTVLLQDFTWPECN